MRHAIFLFMAFLIVCVESKAEEQARYIFNPATFTNYCGELLVDAEMVEKVSRMESKDKQEKYLVETAEEDIDKELKENKPSKYKADCLKKATAIRLLGKIPGTNHVEVLIHELSFADPNMKKASVECPAIEALIDKGQDAEDALWRFLENANLEEVAKHYTDERAGEYDRIMHAIWALKAINRNDPKFDNEVEKRKNKIDRQILQQLVVRTGTLYQLYRKQKKQN